jgi:ATP-dependent DNA helicase RecQ
MTDAARPILRGEASITLRRDTVQSADAKPAVRSLVPDGDAPLLSALKAKRRALAEAAGVPAYIVFADRTLIEMAERRPSSLDEMARITGVGAKKLESFGTAFLEVITGTGAGSLHPQRLRLAGTAAGGVFDRLAETQLRLARGEDGTGKLLSCTQAELRRIAEAQPLTLSDLDRVASLGPQKLDRFGPAFLAVLRDG